MYFREKNKMGIQIGAVAKRNTQNNMQKIAASISSPPAGSGASHMIEKAAENVPAGNIISIAN
jgi:hypothetical protein